MALNPLLQWVITETSFITSQKGEKASYLMNRYELGRTMFVKMAAVTSRWICVMLVLHMVSVGCAVLGMVINFLSLDFGARFVRYDAVRFYLQKIPYLAGTETIYLRSINVIKLSVAILDIITDITSIVIIRTITNLTTASIVFWKSYDLTVTHFIPCMSLFHRWNQLCPLPPSYPEQHLHGRHGSKQSCRW